MDLSAFVLGCVISALLANGGAPTESGPPTAGGQDERTAKAIAAFEGQRFMEAALEFEQLNRDFPGEGRYLYNAAVSRSALAHNAHTIAYLEEFLRRPQITADDRRIVENELALARAATQVVAVTLTTLPEQLPGVRLEAGFASDFVSDIRPPLRIFIDSAQRGARGEIALDPGNWSIRGYCPGSFRSNSESTVAVRRGAPTEIVLAVDCRPTAPPGTDDDGERPRRTFAVVGGSLGAVAAITGAVLAGVHVPMRNAVLAADGQTSAGVCVADDCHDKLVREYLWTSAAAPLIGVGVGLAVGGGTAAFARARTRMIAWSAEAGLGGALALGGLIGHLVLLDRQNDRRHHGTASPIAWQDFRGRELEAMLNRNFVAQVGLGLGLGLVATAVIGLASDGRRASRQGLRASVLSAPGSWGAALVGRF